MLKRSGKRRISLDDAILEWSSERTVLMYEYEYELRKGVWTDPELYYTSQDDYFSIENFPEVLYIELNHRSMMESGKEITTSSVLKDLSTF